MTYITVTDAQNYLGVAAGSDTTLITTLVGAAQAAIESYCDRRFAAAADETHTFDARLETDGLLLHLDAELCQVTSIVNGDAAASVLSPDDYVLVPATPPHLAILLRSTSLQLWQGEISVIGRWAYSVTPPASIAQATREYVGYLYRTYDQQGDPRHAADRGLPTHIQQLLEGYQRLR
jgi:hypothetical protein